MDDVDFDGASGSSVAELIDQALQNHAAGETKRNVPQLIEAVRVSTLKFSEPGGLLPNYLRNSGLIGAGSFSLVNR